MCTDSRDKRQEKPAQEGAEGCERFPQITALREKVARAIYAIDPDIKDGHRFIEVKFEERVKYFGSDPLYEAADAAITACLSALIEMELPEEANLAAKLVAYQSYNNWQPEFRAILTSLQSNFTEAK